jgi:hypothetical protein
MQDPFYKMGLRFECTRCSKCCRHTPGYVFLSSMDLYALSKKINIDKQDFLNRYCRTIELGVARRISLKEKPNLDCILWADGGCSLYDSRPLQCRSFPFWNACVSSRKEWELHAASCPGIGRGPIHTREEIDDWLAQRSSEGFLEG